MKYLKATVAAAGVALAATIVVAGGHANPAVEAGVKARKAHMQLYAHNLGRLGAMAKGEAPYDSEAAASAAANLAALSRLSQQGYWPEGSSNESFENTRALPAIWNDLPGVMEKSAALTEATASLADAAGTDLASLQAAIGAVGGACGACHKAYRQSDN
ncbi:MAG: cytochrome c [Rhodobacteraceae bacterium]|nr:cytochrome c [Paracoccaceae bacterium]